MTERLRLAVREFVRTMHNPYDLDDLLDRLLLHATSALGCAGAGIMLEDDRGRLEFAAASSDTVMQAECVQAEIQSGVCHEAFTTGELLAVSDLAVTDRFGGYTERVVELGFRAVIGVPLTAWGQTIGVLNLYRDRPTSWSEADIEAAEMLAAMGASYILGATRTQAQNELAENLHAALASRGTIERAKGIIMEREGVDARTAFDRLRTASMNGNHKLRDVADQIIEHHESQCPMRASEATSHQPPADVATANGPDVVPTAAAPTVATEDGVGNTAVGEIGPSRLGSR